MENIINYSDMDFFTTPFLWPLHETPYDEYRYTSYSLKRYLEEAGFSHIKLEPLGGWNANLAQMLGLWLKRSPMSNFKRRLLTNTFFPFCKFLIKKDRNLIREGQMITGLSGTAAK